MARPSRDGPDDGGEVVVGEHHAGGLLRDLGAGRPSPRRCRRFRSAGASLTPSPVIATTCPRACKAATMRSLCSGATRANTATLGSTAAERRVVHPVELGSGRRASPSQAEGPGDGGGGRALVAGDHLDGRSRRCWQSATASRASARGGSDHPDQADEREVGDQRGRARCFGSKSAARSSPDGDGQDPQPAGGQPIVLVADALPRRRRRADVPRRP